MLAYASGGNLGHHRHGDPDRRLCRGPQAHTEESSTMRGLSPPSRKPRRTGERVWELPMDDERLKRRSPEIADVLNTRGRYGAPSRRPCSPRVCWRRHQVAARTSPAWILPTRSTVITEKAPPVSASVPPQLFEFYEFEGSNKGLLVPYPKDGDRNVPKGLMFSLPRIL